MPILNGLETAAALSASSLTRQLVPHVVFVTAYDEYAVRAFEANALDYLLKPLEKDRLAITMQRLIESSTTKQLANPLEPLNSTQVTLSLLKELKRRGQKNKLTVKSGQNYLVIQEDQLSAILACDHYVEILHGEKTMLAEDTLDSLERRLSSKRFIRIHRSSLINLDYLKEIKRLGDRKYSAILENYFQSELPISRDKIDLLKTVLLENL